MTISTTLKLSSFVLATALTTLSTTAFAQKAGGATPADGTITIDQSKALTGSITPGDGAGFPVTITQNGTYRLTGNLNVPAGLNGIVVSAGVHAIIDMAGYSIVGAAVCSATVNCYQQQSGTNGIDVGENGTVHVSNGRIRGFSRAGIDGHDSGSLVRATDMEVSHNGRGISATRLMGVRILANSNSQQGIYAVQGSIVDSFASLNHVGIAMSAGSVRGSSAYLNTFGYWLPAATYQDNTATANNAVMMVVPQFPGSNNAF